MSLAAGLFLFWFLIVARLFNLQILNYGIYSALASGQHEVYEKLFPARGRIFVRENTTPAGGAGLYPLAANREYDLIYAVPKEIKNATDTAEDLIEALALDWEAIEQARLDQSAEPAGPPLETVKANFLVNLAAKLSKKDDPYEPIKHKASEAEVAKIKELNLTGVYLTPETFRYYPEGELASQILGFVGFKDDQRVGLYGLEGYFNDELAGQPGVLASEKDARGYLITIGRHLLKEAENGADLVLTIDHTIQYYACQKLKEAVEWHQAESGTLVIMEPFTGAIVAMCDFPDFNPNEYEKAAGVNVFNNQAIFDAYEPGSVFKAITMAAALDTNKVTPQTTYNDEGPLKFHQYQIKNSDDQYHGVQTMIEVLDKSLNTGAVFAVEQTGVDIFAKYVEDFGFGSLTDITLIGESAGDVSALKKPGEIYAATASYGQGITVTALQLAAAFSAIANGGNLVQPYLIDEIIGPAGQSQKTEPRIVRQVISPRAATLLKGMLASVVKGVHGQNAAVNGYTVAGKTGTAQIPRKDGPGYETNAHIGTFVGFAPVDNPRFTMVVRIVKPQSVKFAESSAAPLFGQIAKFLLNYYQVPPDDLVME